MIGFIYPAIFIYLIVVIVLTRKIASFLEQGMRDELKKIQDTHKLREQEKIAISAKRSKAEEETNQIFTFYELTKEITKTFDEEEVIRIFKDKLKESVDFSECEILDSAPDAKPSFQIEGGRYSFPLQWEGKTVGALNVRDLKRNDQEKVMILGHQLALALRRIKLYKEIERLAITDSLTGLHTRRYFLDRFEEELKRATLRKLPLSFLIMDVDRFKNINDEYGHLTGDHVLREIGEIIKQNIREIDIAGRYGGEEFTVALPDTNKEGARFAAERIRAAVEKTVMRAYDNDIRSTISIGTTTYPQDGKTSHELLDRADWALYRAKKMGRNNICTFGVYKD